MKQTIVPLFVALCLFALGCWLFFHSIHPAKPPDGVCPLPMPLTQDTKAVSATGTPEVHADRLLARAAWEEAERFLQAFAEKNQIVFDLMIAESQAHLGTLATETLAGLEKRVAADRRLELVFRLACVFEAAGNLTKARGLLKQMQSAKPTPYILEQVHLRLGEVMILLGEFDEAERSYQAAIDLNPNHPEGFIQLFKLRLRRGDPGNLAALRALGDQRHRSHFAYNLRLGQLLLHAGFASEARESFKQVLALRPAYFPARIALYQSFVRAKDTENALRELEIIYQNNFPFPPLVAEGRVYFDAAHAARTGGRLDLSLRFYTHALLCDHSLLGEDDRGLLTDLQMYVDQKGSSAERTFWQAFMTYVGGEVRRAPQIVAPLLTDTSNSRWQIEARRLVDECRRVEAEDAAYYDFVARVKSGMKASDTAEADEAATWKRAASATAPLPGRKREPVLLPSFAIGTRGPDTETRAEALRRLITSQPLSPRLIHEAGVLLAEIGALDDSLACFERILADDESDPQARLAQARLLQATGAYQKLLSDMARAVSLQPGHPGLQTAYAVALLKYGDPRRGFLESRQALQSGSEAPELRLARAEFFLALGRLAEARREVSLVPADISLPRSLQNHLDLIQLQLECSKP